MKMKSKMEFLQRKNMPLKKFDYDKNGAYFITICTENRKQILSKIQLLEFGKIADKYIGLLNNFYNNISIDKYIIMPDHIHLILSIQGGQSRTPVPTNVNLKKDNKNSVIAKFVSTFKRFCNKEYGENIWNQDITTI